MTHTHHSLLRGASIFLASGGFAHSALILNAAKPITHQVVVQPIQTQQAVADGGASANLFGTPAQEAIIKGFIDDIWAQAGIDIEWLSTTTYIDSFAYDGHPDDYPSGGIARPTIDLTTINNTAPSPPKSSSPTVLNIFFVDVVPGFTFTSQNTANGLAYVDGNGITQFVGANLPGFNAGREVVASVIAHEIGHNLGLPHVAEAENLLQSGGSPDQGERIGQAQIDLIFTDNPGNDGFELLQAIPEPSSALLVGLGLLFLGRRR